MSRYGLSVWHGSGLTNPDMAVRILGTMRKYLDLKDPIPVFGQSMILSAVVRPEIGGKNLQDLRTDFYDMLSYCDPMMIICLDGGTGAARVVSEPNSLGEHKHVIVGCSDNSVYLLAAWLYGFSEYAFYGTNFLDIDLIASLERIHDYLEIRNRTFEFGLVMGYNLPDTVVGKSGVFDQEYIVLPMTIRPMLQLSGKVRRAFMQELCKQPCLLMLEDAYPPNDLNWIGFYEDLTQLIPFVKAVANGGGAVAFAPAPGLLRARNGTYYGKRVPDHVLSKEMLKTADVDIPLFTNLRFGHQNIPGSSCIVPFGERMKVHYQDNCLTLVGEGGTFADCCNSACESNASESFQRQ